MRLHHPVILAACLTAACSSSSPASPPSADGCAAAWDDLAGWAARLEREPSHRYDEFTFPLVEAGFVTDPKDLGGHGYLEFVMFEGKIAVGGQDVVHEGLERLVQKDFYRLSTMHRLRLGVELALAKDTPWSAVVEAVEMSRRYGATEVVFWFGRPGAVSRPRWSWIDLDLYQTASRVRNDYDPEIYPPYRYPRPDDQRGNLARVLHACPDLAERAGEPGHAIAADLVGYRDECRCRVSQRNLRAVLWKMNPADQVTARLLPLGTDAEPGTIVDAPADATWAEVAPRIIAAAPGDPVSLRVR
jgi:hypothetical protein